MIVNVEAVEEKLLPETQLLAMEARRFQRNAEEMEKVQKKR